MVTDKHKDLLYAQPAALGKLMKCMLQIADQSSGYIRKKKSDCVRKDANVIVISGHDVNSTSYSECWNLNRNMKFEELCKLPFSFPWHSACQIPGGFVATGGVGNNLCAMFILSSKSWKQLEPLPAPRYSHGSVFISRKIYLFGGYVSGALQSSVISLDLNGGIWDQEPAMPIRVKHPEVARVDSSLFLFDQYDNKQLLQLDMMGKTWSTKASPPQQNYYAGARMISVNGQLVVCGGNNQVFDQYSPSTDTWTTRKAPTLKHDLGALVHHEEKLYLIGGCEEDRVEENDLDTNAWSVCDGKIARNMCNIYAFAV